MISVLHCWMLPFDTGIHGLPRWLSDKEPACQCWRRKKFEFDPWVGKIPWKRAWQPTIVFLPGESPWTERSLTGYSPWGHKVGHNWAPKHTQQHPHFRSQRLGSWCHVWSGVKYKQLWGMLLRQLGKYGYVDTCFRICLMVLTLMLWLWWRQLSS